MNGSDLGRVLILLGVGAILLGGVIIVLSKFVGLGHLPGDISIKGENFGFYFPVMSCLIISIVLTVVLNLFHR